MQPKRIVIGKNQEHQQHKDMKAHNELLKTSSREKQVNDHIDSPIPGSLYRSIFNNSKEYANEVKNMTAFKISRQYQMRMN